jgi:hypothetical protein
MSDDVISLGAERDKRRNAAALAKLGRKASLRAEAGSVLLRFGAEVQPGDELTYTPKQARDLANKLLRLAHAAEEQASKERGDSPLQRWLHWLGVYAKVEAFAARRGIALDALLGAERSQELDEHRAALWSDPVIFGARGAAEIAKAWGIGASIVRRLRKLGQDRGDWQWNAKRGARLTVEGES